MSDVVSTHGRGQQILALLERRIAHESAAVTLAWPSWPGHGTTLDGDYYRWRCQQKEGKPSAIPQTPGELPVYRERVSGVTVTSFETISRHLQDQNYNADFELDQKQQSDVKAYEQWLQDMLLPGLLYTWWVDSKNYVDLSRPWFARALPFPLNYFVPGQRQRNAKSYLLSKFGLHPEQELHLENLVLKNSQECLNLLAERLEKREFFFGRSPTSMDALVFAYLAPLLKVPFPNPMIQNHLKSCNNLVSFVVRILQRYFPSSVANLEIPTSKNTGMSIVDEFPNKHRNQFLACLAASTAMIGYALTVGLVQVDMAYSMENDDQDEDDDNSNADFQPFDN